MIDESDHLGRRDEPCAGNEPIDRLLPGAHHLPAEDRSVLLEAFARLVHPTALVVAVYLFLVGLHHPGGGFAAGLVVGLGLLLRRVAGGARDLGATARANPGILLGAGLALAAGYGIAGLVLSGDLLHGTVLHLKLPLLGSHALPTSMVFDLGVLLITVGVVLDVLRTLGEEDSR